MWDITPRDMMKALGTTFFRSEDPDHWTKHMAFRMNDLGHVVVTDVRFENEANPKYRRRNVLVGQNTKFSQK